MMTTIPVRMMMASIPQRPIRIIYNRNNNQRDASSDRCLVHRVERFITFLDFWKPTHFCRSGMFSWAQFQNIGNFGRVHAAKFSFFITGTLKIKIFLKMLRNLSYKSKNIRQKLNSKLNFFHINLYFTKMGKTVFNLYKEKMFF